MLPFLERCLGDLAARETFRRLLEENWEQKFLELHPDLSENELSFLSSAESSERLTNAFRILLNRDRLTKDALSFPIGLNHTTE